MGWREGDKLVKKFKRNLRKAEKIIVESKRGRRDKGKKKKMRVKAIKLKRESGHE